MNYVHTLKQVVPRPLWPYLNQARRRLHSIHARTLRQKRALETDPNLTGADRELLKNVASEIHYNDTMYKGDGRHYFSVGLSAIRCLDYALTAAGLKAVNVALDMPCGHGRVLRFLVRRFPETKFIACDLDRNGVDYCAETFGVEGIYSRPDLDGLDLGRRVDLIWCGSLLTHLDQPRISALLHFFARHLVEHGLVVFTTAGERVVEWMTTRQFDYGIAQEEIPIICGAYAKDGYAYTDYPYMSDYGISLTSPEWIRKQVAEVGGLREITFQPHAWDDHQDVYAFVRD